MSKPRRRSDTSLCSFNPNAVTTVTRLRELFMYTNTLATLADCQEVIRRYGLDHSSLGGGTVEGFTAFLLCGSVQLQGVEHLAMLLDAYRSRAAADIRANGALDESAALEDARMLAELLDSHVKARREICDHIRQTKLQPGGLLLWNCIAELATTPSANHPAIFDRSGLTVAKVKQSLDWLPELRWFLFESIHTLKYRPGQDTKLDGLIRMDIERFDETLASAPPWSGAQDDTAYELAAICRLIGMQ